MCRDDGARDDGRSRDDQCQRVGLTQSLPSVGVTLGAFLTCAPTVNTMDSAATADHVTGPSPCIRIDPLHSPVQVSA